MIKMRHIDIAISIFAIMITSPLLLLVYMLLRISGNDPIYKHKRVGVNGVQFQCIKFRSMVDIESLSKEERNRVESDIKNYGKVYNDPRITRLGKLIRKTSIDELPQFFNVLAGDMSIIGPRPITESELSIYGKKASSYLSVKPGLTGLWQVSGRSNTSYSRRVAIDHYFAKHNSIKLKFFIFIKTFYVVLLMKGSQ